MRSMGEEATGAFTGLKTKTKLAETGEWEEGVTPSDEVAGIRSDTPAGVFDPKTGETRETSDVVSAKYGFKPSDDPKTAKAAAAAEKRFAKKEAAALGTDQSVADSMNKARSWVDSRMKSTGKGKGLTKAQRAGSIADKACLLYTSPSPRD